jgi:hypothetical protein
MVAMPVYEFQCDKGHVTERMVPMGTREIVCSACIEERMAGGSTPSNPMARRILSPTPTTFKFADRAGK